MAVDHTFLHEGTIPGRSLTLIVAYSFQPATGFVMTLSSSVPFQNAAALSWKGPL